MSDLDDSKAAQKTIIKQAFQNALLAGYVDADTGIKLDCKSEDISRLKFTCDQWESQVRVRDYNNEYSTLDLSTLQYIVWKMEAYIVSVLNKKWDLDIAIDACQSVSDVSTVVW